MKWYNASILHGEIKWPIMDLNFRYSKSNLLLLYDGNNVFLGYCEGTINYNLGWINQSGKTVYPTHWADIEENLPK